MKSPKNVPVSVRQRLLNRARNEKRPFNELLQYYAMERFLFRLFLNLHQLNMPFLDSCKELNNVNLIPCNVKKYYIIF